MPVPKVAVVGRPNVGKSSLFNWLVGQRIAIVDPTSGVTRDRQTFLLEVEGRYLELTDTGGMGVEDRDGLTADVERQITHAIEEADLILFVVDAMTGMTGLDQLVVERLRRGGKPVLGVVNKCDNPRLRVQAMEYHKLGLDLAFVSVTANFNRPGLVDAILERLPIETDPSSSPVHLANIALKLAVVGKRNAGKSTFINSLAQQERVIVSEVPGTTRDSIDVRFERNGQTLIAIDTAGVRKRKSLNDSIEFYSFTRAQKSIRRADVVLMMFDASEEIGQVDKQLVGDIIDQHKPCVFAVNKWDLVQALATERFSDYIDQCFPQLEYAPRVFLTAKTGRNVHALVDVCQSLFAQANERVGTGELNRVLREALTAKSPPIRQNRVPKIFYASQVAVAPPTLVLFCNEPKLFDPGYRRYLVNFLRDRLPFAEVPINLTFRRRVSTGERTHTPEEEQLDLRDRLPDEEELRSALLDEDDNREE